MTTEFSRNGERVDNENQRNFERVREKQVISLLSEYRIAQNMMHAALMEEPSPAIEAANQLAEVRLEEIRKELGTTKESMSRLFTRHNGLSESEVLKAASASLMGETDFCHSPFFKNSNPAQAGTPLQEEQVMELIQEYWKTELGIESSKMQENTAAVAMANQIAELRLQEIASELGVIRESIPKSPTSYSDLSDRAILKAAARKLVQGL